MVFVKAANCLMLAGGLWTLTAMQFAVTHEHVHKGCAGVMTVDAAGVSFAGAKGHSWNWKYEDIEELKLEPAEIRIVTYKDSKLRFGANRAYAFSGDIPAAELYRLWKDRLDQRFVAALAGGQTEGFSISVKHARHFGGSEGTLVFSAEAVSYLTPAGGESRAWRYSDIDSISSSGPFELTITTFERDVFDYGNRMDFHFQLKQPITEARYNQLWLDVEKKNGRIQ